MKTVSFPDLYDMDYKLEIVRVKCHWENDPIPKRHHKARKCNGLMYCLDVTGGFYRDSNLLCSVEKGSVIYLPDEIQYDTLIEARKSRDTAAVNEYLIEFKLYDQNGASFRLSDHIQKLPIDSVKYLNLFDQINTLSHFARKPQMKIQALLYTILSNISETYNNSGLDARTIDTVHKAIFYIDAHHTLPLQIPEIAAMYHISESTFRRYFKRITGYSPAQYIRNLRLDRAENLLLTNAYTVQEVAEIVGIPDPAHFSKLYKTHFGISPATTLKRAKHI